MFINIDLCYSFFITKVSKGLFNNLFFAVFVHKASFPRLPVSTPSPIINTLYTLLDIHSIILKHIFSFITDSVREICHFTLTNAIVAAQSTDRQSPPRHFKSIFSLLASEFGFVGKVERRKPGLVVEARQIPAESDPISA